MSAGDEFPGAGTGASLAPRRPVAVLNPVAPGYPLAVKSIHVRASEWGWPRVKVLHTSANDFGSSQARQALELGADLVLVGGGDGTVRAVAHELRRHQVALGIVPLGTANLYARNLRIPLRDIRAAVDVAMLGAPARLDLGTARFRSEAEPGEWSAEHLFLVLAGLGNDADTVMDTRPLLKKRLGWLAYFESGARHLSGDAFGVRIATDGGDPSTEVVWSFLAGNCGRIPAGITIFPGAMLDDGLLRTMEVRITRLHQWMPVAMRGILSRTAISPRLVPGVAHSVHLTPARPVALQLDGDVFGPVVELEVGIDARSLLVKLPAATARRQLRHLARRWSR